jgi:hypothetical protein
MKTKKAAIIFMLFTNIILLVNAAIPHQHVDGITSIFHFHLHTQNIPHDHSSDTEDDEHGHEDIYWLKQSAQISRCEFRANLPKDRFPDNFQSVFCQDNTFIAEIFFKIWQRFPEIPPNFYACSINDGIGLRAPPIV